MPGCRSKLQNDGQEQYHKPTTECCQLKLHRTKRTKTDDDFGEFIRHFHENEMVQPVLDRINLIENQWRTLDLWEIVQSVNPHPMMKFSRNELFKQDFTLLDNEDLTFRRSNVLCSMFEDLMSTLEWKVGDTHAIEEDICDVVGQLLMKVEKKDRSSLLDFMQGAIMTIQANGSEQVGGKLRKLLITKKKYNGLNLACLLLEQMIIDIKDNNVSWIRIVCAQFIDLVVQLIIEPGYREDVHSILTHLLKKESEWKVMDIYNLMKNGLLMFRGKQKKFHRYLMIIRNFALHPSLNISPIKKKRPVELKDILLSHDKNKWRSIDDVVLWKRDRYNCGPGSRGIEGK